MLLIKIGFCAADPDRLIPMNTPQDLALRARVFFRDSDLRELTGNPNAKLIMEQAQNLRKVQDDDEQYLMLSGAIGSGKTILSN